MIRQVVLWSDALFMLLLLALCIGMYKVYRNEQLRSTWRQVIRRPIGMCSGLVLAFYLSVALLDSLHFRMSLEVGAEGSGSGPSKAVNHYSAEVLSVLDLIFSDLKNNVEKTYSAPLAARSFAKESWEDESHKVIRGFPRLVFGGAHLEDPERDLAGDLIKRSVQAILSGLSVSLFICLLFFSIYSRRCRTTFKQSVKEVLNRETYLPWFWALLSASMFVIFFSWVFGLSAHYHIFGTDKVGNDVFYQSIKSVRTGVMIGLLTTFITLPLAIVLGISAGYFRGWVDDVIQYIYITLNSIPGILLIVAAVLMLDVIITNNSRLFETEAARSDARLLALCIVLGITSWTSLCRLLRAETLKTRELDYVTAAEAFGVRTPLILARHILPNLMHLVLIAIAIDFSGLVLAEAVLSYIGVGVDPGMHSWGNMINSARMELAREPVVWWSLASAFFMMFMLVLAANLFADTVRDVLDPRTRNVLRGA